METKFSISNRLVKSSGVSVKAGAEVLKLQQDIQEDDKTFGATGKQSLIPQITLSYIHKLNKINQVDNAIQEISDEEIKKLILFDARMSMANTIRNFLEQQSNNDQKLLREILESDAFAECVLSGKQSKIPCSSQLKSFSEGDLDTIDDLLLSLSAYLHIETGTKLRFFELTYDDYKQRDNLAIESYTNYKINHKDPELDIDKVSIALFSEIVKGKAEPYRSIFEGQVRDIVILTHNRNVLSQTIGMYLANIAKYGHQNITIHIFDDSNDEKQRGLRKASVIGHSNLNEKLINKYGVKIKIKYFDQDQRERELKQTNRALAKGGGVGVNRNWALEKFKGQNFVMIDDDVFPFVRTHLIEDESPSPDLKDIGVDFLSIINRNIMQPNMGSICFSYVNIDDYKNDICLHDWMNSDSAYQSKTHPLLGKEEMYNVLDILQRQQNSCLFEPKIKSGSTQGGAWAIAAAKNPMLTLIPCPPARENYLRYEDFTVGLCYSILEKYFESKQFSVYYPAAGLHHHKQVNTELGNIAKSIVNEKIGTVFFGLIVGKAMHQACQNISMQSTTLDEELMLKILKKLSENIRIRIKNTTGKEIIDMLSDKKKRESIREIHHLMKLGLGRSDSKHEKIPYITAGIKEIFSENGLPIKSQTKIFNNLFEVAKVELEAYADAIDDWVAALTNV